MVQEERRQDLKNMFYLLNGIPGALDVLLTEFEQRIKSQGLERGREREEDGNIIISSLSLSIRFGCSQYIGH